MGDTYVTRGRLAELHQAIGELEGRLTARLDALEGRLDRVQAASLEVLRLETQAHLDLYRKLTVNGHRKENEK